MSRSVTVTVTANPDEDDCLAAAEREYISEHPELRGYDLSPRWTDEDDRETVDLTVPAWVVEPRDLADEAACRADHEYDQRRDDERMGLWDE